MSELKLEHIGHPDAVSNALTFDSDGSIAVSGNLAVDTNALYVNTTNDHIGFGTTSPSSSNGAIGKVVGASSSANNVLSGETTGGVGYSGWIIEARQNGRTGNARFSQLVMNTDGSDNGQMIFQNAVAGADVTESIRVNSSGISFDAGSNYLDDYEEGTWSPTITSGGLTISTSYSSTYTKIGRLVMLRTWLLLSASGATSSAFIIGNMPFTSRSGGYTAGAVDIGFGGIKGTYSRVEGSNTTIGFYYPSENTGVTRSTLAGNQIGNGYIIVTITYETDS